MEFIVGNLKNFIFKVLSKKKKLEKGKVIKKNRNESKNKLRKFNSSKENTEN